MSVDYTHALISGPKKHETAMLGELNNIPGFVAHLADPRPEYNADLAWIEVWSYRVLNASEDSEEAFARRIHDELESERLNRYQFQIVSAGSPFAIESAPYSSHKLTGPIGSASALVISEPPTAELLWDQLRRIARTPILLASLEEYPNAVEIHEEFSSFVGQAETYFRGAVKTDGPSAALLLYYSLLNLAKAELLLWKPELILNGTNKIMHGVSAVHSTPELRDWTVKIQKQGVFPALYEKRIGVAWPQQAPSIEAVDLFARCPETALEFRQVGYGSEQTAGFFHSIVTDGTASWSQLLVHNYGTLQSNPPVKELLLEYYRELPLPRHDQDVYAVFDVSRRINLQRGMLLMARYPKLVRTQPNFILAGIAYEDWLPEARSKLRPVLGGQKLGFDGILSNSISTDSLIGLPDDLARYVAIYLVSSLVRYRPSALNMALHSEQAWYLSAFVRQCFLPALLSFANQILDQELIFVDTRRS